MARCPAHGNRIQLNSSRAVNLFGATPQPDCRWIPILPNITDISVTIVATGVAEVRGLTTDGINSRWGSAVRSKVDSACWTGSDFEICAY